MHCNSLPFFFILLFLFLVSFCRSVPPEFLRSFFIFSQTSFMATLLQYMNLFLKHNMFQHQAPITSKLHPKVSNIYSQPQFFIQKPLHNNLHQYLQMTINWILNSQNKEAKVVRIPLRYCIGTIWKHKRRLRKSRRRQVINKRRHQNHSWRLHY